MARKGEVLDEYKGFRERKCIDSNDYTNVFYVTEEGEERCAGQTWNFRASVEHLIRYPLPGWLIKKEKAEWSPWADPDHIAATCAHNVPLYETCDACIESYGEARLP